MKIAIHSKEECLNILKAKGVDVSSPEVVKDLKEGLNDVLSFLPDGMFDRIWEVIRINHDEEAGEIGDYIVEGAWFVPQIFVKEVIEDETVKVSINSVDGGFLLKKGDKILELTCSEFWEIVRFGDFYDTKSEVKEYIEQLTDPIKGVTPKQFLKRIDEIAEKVISSRLSEENGDQIYYVLESVAREMSVKPKSSLARCGKCVYERHCPKNNDNEGKCSKYKRDAPDGGFYG